MHDGGCECGRVRYRMDDPIVVNCCHCRMCQQKSGSAFALNAMIERDRVEVIAGAAEPVETSQGRFERCPDCLTGLWTYHRLFGDAVRFVYVGTLDRGEALTPDAHFFTVSKHPWIAIPDGVPRFDELPGSDEDLWSPAAKVRLEGALAGNAGQG